MKRTFVIALLALAAVAAASFAYAAIPTNGVITTCYSKSGGTLRVIDATVTNCGSKETSLAWNVQGPKGDAGEPGPQGPAGPAGPAGPVGPSDAYASFKDGPVLNNGTVATLDLPQAGSYVISAKLNARNLTNAPALLQCNLLTGADFDRTWVRLGPNGAAGDHQSVALAVVRTFAGAGSATLYCADGGEFVTDSIWIKLTAIRVAGLTNNPSS